LPPLTDWEVTSRVMMVPACVCLPMARARRWRRRRSMPACWCAAFAGPDLGRLGRIANTISRARWMRDQGQGIAVGSRLAEQLSVPPATTSRWLVPHGA